MKHISLLVLVLAALTPIAALAAPPPAPTSTKPPAVPAPAASAPVAGTAYLSTRAQLAERVSLLKLEVQAQKLQSKLHPQARSTLQTTQPAPASSSNVVAQVSLPQVPVTPSMAVVSILAAGNHRVAAIRAGAMTVTVHRGNVLPNGWKVAAITPDRVTLVQGRKVTHLKVSP